MPGGIGWYRKTFTIDAALKRKLRHELFKANQRKAFHGMALAIVQAKLKVGRIVLKARSTVWSLLLS